ncbi:glycerate kinase type-2 family protein [Natronobiforma cellulositropha]|uniref:glycerate kinase type-2 family protein n=1 Tax=Natronobiforma cellulositropha TaxID=1679076 RepID=UPI0021D5FF17|nr:DUF4147 domain-containing protein [Natronobiforma cellulositropha]
MIDDRAALGGDERRETVLECLERGVRAAHPETVIGRELTVEDGVLRVGGATYGLERDGRVVVVGGGNAAGAAALALEERLGEHLQEGVVVSDEALETDRLSVLEGAHPLPGEANVRGAREVVRLAREAGTDDLVIVLVTGGGSAHLTQPADGVSLEALRTVTDRLLAAGAPIGDLNAVRKHLSRLKGGQLARAAHPASVCALVFSDVVGDDLETVASGPVSPDSTSYAEALAVLERYGVDAPDAVRRHLESGAAGDLAETPGPDDPAFERVDTHVLANGRTALEAARACASERGYASALLSTRVRGEAREVARDHVAIAEECALSGEPFEPPVVLVSGGETTVTVAGDGSGGPNAEFVLSAGTELADFPGAVVVGAVDTDGVDGASETAGAIVESGEVDREAARAALAANDASGYFSRYGGVVRTGPTGTNVNDLRVLLVGRE